MKAKVAIALLCLLCGACGSNPPPDPTLKNKEIFNANSAAYIHKSGKGRIIGEAFIITQRGKVIYAAGELIRLIPATAYATERMNKLYNGKQFIAAENIPTFTPNKDYVAFTRTIVANARGKFSFDNVSSGKYYVTAQKIIQDPKNFRSSGGAMYSSVVIDVNKKPVEKVIIVGK